MIKQIIVMRTDLNMRKGKMVAQGAHASLAFLSNYFRTDDSSLSDEEVSWLDGSFTKICVGVESEDRLKEIMEQAKAAGLSVWPIVDSGRTEFKGVPTLTCCAIGPHESEKLESVTGNLKLL